MNYLNIVSGFHGLDQFCIIGLRGLTMWWIRFFPSLHSSCCRTLQGLYYSEIRGSLYIYIYNIVVIFLQNINWNLPLSHSNIRHKVFLIPFIQTQFWVITENIVGLIDHHIIFLRMNKKILILLALHFIAFIYCCYYFLFLYKNWFIKWRELRICSELIINY